MKQKRKILSLILALVLLIATASPASAATVWTTRTGNGCTVALSGECTIVNYSAVMEYQSSDSGDPFDYALQIKLVRTTLRAGDRPVVESPERSLISTRFTSISGQSNWILSKIECTCLINSAAAGIPVSINAN